MHIRLIAIIASLGICGSAHAYETRAPREVDLSGRWTLNAELSDDADAQLRERVEKQLKRERRWREQEEAEAAAQPDAAPRLPERIFAPQADRALPKLREALGLYTALDIRQGDAGAKLEINSPGSSRRFTAGSSSQVSMSNGQLADSEVGWDGEWFVIDRKVRKGPRVVERYRLSKKTDQLQATIAWSRGDSDDLLAGIKLQRVFDRAPGAPPPPDLDSGPVR
jgi:hypothetical protein